MAPCISDRTSSRMFLSRVILNRGTPLKIDTCLAMCFMYTTGLSVGPTATSLIHRSPSESWHARPGANPRQKKEIKKKRVRSRGARQNARMTHTKLFIGHNEKQTREGGGGRGGGFSFVASLSSYLDH